jgi:hypothetical protein
LFVTDLRFYFFIQKIAVEQDGSRDCPEGTRLVYINWVGGRISMNLSYRGVKYRFTPFTPVATTSEVIGRYRGQPCRRSHFDLSLSQPRLTLKYRGVSYVTGSQGQMASEPVAHDLKMAPVVGMTDLRRMQSELEKVHNLSIQRNVERRLDVARSQGNQTLIHILENEQKQLAS